MEGSSSLKRKHAETEEDRLRGLFTDDSIPEHFYPIGDNFFILASSYQNKAAIHIRKYNKYEKYYPSVYGITLTVEQFAVCFKHGPPTSIFDIADINLTLESVNPNEKRELFILTTDDGQYSFTKQTTCKSGRVYKHSTDISFSQWTAIRKIYDDVISSYISIKFASNDLLVTFKTVSKRVLPVDKPVNHKRYKEAETLINYWLSVVLYKHISEKKGLAPPIRVSDDEIEITDIVPFTDYNESRDFNESCLSLNVIGVVRDFEQELCGNMLYPEREHLINFLSEQYLKAIHLDEFIKKRFLYK